MHPLQVRFKSGRVIPLMHPMLARGLWMLCEIIHSETGKVPVVTSIWDQTHSDVSLHFIGCAADVRSKTLSNEEKDRVLMRAISTLGDEYDLLIEDPDGPNEHFHLEWDKGKFNRSKSIREAFGHIERVED